MTALRWFLIVAALALVVGLIIEARGDDHHRGDETGSVAQVVR
jgi:hypothetical protein